MTVNLDLKPELAKRVREVAETAGLDVNTYLLRLLEYQLPEGAAPRTSLQEILTPDEWLRAFEEWANSHDPSIPPLPDEAVSRESFYEGRP